MNNNDDINSLSGISFPSLDRMHLQEEGIVLPSTPSDGATSDDEANGTPGNNAAGAGNTELAIDVNPTSPNHGDECDDGYPTDEHTCSLEREREAKRLSVLQLARRRLAKKNAGGVPKDIDATSAPPAGAVDDVSFLADANIADVENNGPDDATFLASAAVEDAPDDLQSIGTRGDGTVDTNYDMFASTLSRASESTKASTIGDRVLKDSIMAAQMMAKSDNRSPGADNQSASTYSYKRAYVDNVTLGSNFTSTCSGLTDDYCFDARNRTGMSEAVRVKGIHEDRPYSDEVTRPRVGPIDTDTGSMLRQSDESQEESVARPPPPNLHNQQADLMAYDTRQEDLTRMVSFGEGEGYVDEEAARKYAAVERRSGCCGWFASSSRTVKLVVACSTLLMLISVASVALALLLPKEGDASETSTAVSSAASDTRVGEVPEGQADDDDTSGWDGLITSEPTYSPTYMPTTATNLTSSPSPSAPAVDTISPTDTLAPPTCAMDTPCFEEGSRCTDGSTETCCGETFDSFVCDCATVNGKLQYTCFYSDACLAPPCETNEPSSVSTISPTTKPTISPTAKPRTLSPSKSPEALIFTTSSLTGTPSDEPSAVPTTLQPTRRPTNMPTANPSNQPTISPSKEPTRQPATPLPTTTQPTPMPTEFPVSTVPPSSNAPTLIQTIKLEATKDTYINARWPNYAYGSFRRIRVDLSPRAWSLISFDTDGIDKSRKQNQSENQNEPRKLQAIRVLKAKLRLYVLDGGGGGIVFSLPNDKQNWSETQTTWNNMGQQVDRSGEFRVGSLDWVDSSTWCEVDVTSAFEGSFGSNSVVQSFLIKSTDSNGVEWASRERGPGPELVLTIASGDDIGADWPIISPTPAPYWPTYYPTKADTDEPTTPRPSSPPSKPPTLRPSWIPTSKPNPTLLPSRPSKQPTTRAPHKRPLRPHRLPTISPSPTYTQTEEFVSASSAIAVPPGCQATDDVNLALKQALMPSNHNMHVVFPSQDAYIRGGIYSDNNFGSSTTLVLEPTSKALIEFDIGLIAVTSSVYNILSITLRLYIDRIESAGDNISLSIFTHTIEWDEDQVTWNNFGSPPMTELGSDLFKVERSDEGNWVDLDITDFISLHSQEKKFMMAVKGASASGEGTQCEIASRKTCRSPKLIAITETV